MTAKSPDLKSSWTDPDDAPELTDEWFEKATPKVGGKPVSRNEAKAAFSAVLKRGRPKTERRKVLLSVRYSQEVVDYFRATGEGWQARMDAALKEWIEAHPRRT